MHRTLFWKQWKRRYKKPPGPAMVLKMKFARILIVKTVTSVCIDCRRSWKRLKIQPSRFLCRMRALIKAKNIAATAPPNTGEITQLAAIMLIELQFTAPRPAAAIPAPMTPPTTEWVVETGAPTHVARLTQSAEETSAAIIAQMNTRVSDTPAGSMMPLEMVETTSPPASKAPADSHKAAMTMARVQLLLSEQRLTVEEALGRARAPGRPALTRSPPQLQHRARVAGEEGLLAVRIVVDSVGNGASIIGSWLRDEGTTLLDVCKFVWRFVKNGALALFGLIGLAAFAVTARLKVLSKRVALPKDQAAARLAVRAVRKSSRCRGA